MVLGGSRAVNGDFSDLWAGDLRISRMALNSALTGPWQEGRVAA